MGVDATVGGIFVVITVEETVDGTLVVTVDVKLLFKNKRFLF